MSSNFQLILEHIGPGEGCQRFRLAFSDSDDRYLLNYPEVQSLTFRHIATSNRPKMETRYLISAPQEEFVLRPGDRIAFDLRAYVNQQPDRDRLWAVSLEAGEYEVQYRYSIDPRRRRYDYLQKGSRFADITRPWSGTVLSNAVMLQVAAAD